MVLSISILEFTNLRKEDSFSTKERKLIFLKHLRNLSIMMLLGICIAYAYSSNVYAASATATISKNGYLYIPRSAGCPQIPELWETYEYKYWLEDPYYSFSGYRRVNPGEAAPSGGRDRSTGYHVIFWYGGNDTYAYSSTWDNPDVVGYISRYLVVNPNPVIDGNNLRYQILGYYSYVSSMYGDFRTLSNWPTTYYDYSTQKSVPYTISVNTNGSHSFTNTANATCTTAATQKCSRCGVTQSVGSPLGHSWGAWQVLKEATVYAAGSQTHVCARNSGHTETVAIPQKHFQIYAGSSQIQKVYLGAELIMDAASGEEALVK